MSIENNVSKNILWNILEKSVNFLNSLFVIFILTNYFGSSLFGFYSYVISIVSLVSFVAYFGLESVLVNEFVRKKFNTKELLGTSIILLFASSSLAFILICFVNYIFIDDKSLSILIYIYGGMVFAAPLNIFYIYFNSKIDLIAISKIKIILLVLILIIKILLVYFNLKILAFIIMELITILSIAFVSLFAYLYKGYKLSFQFKISTLFYLIKKGIPLMISAGAIVIYGKVDTILIEYFLDMNEVGVYSVALRISELWYVVPMSISAIFLPTIVKAKKTSKAAYYQQVSMCSQIMVVVCMLFTITLIFLISNVIHIFLSEDYINVGSLIMILAWCGPFVGLGYINGGCMVIENYLYLTMKRNIYGMIINIVLNIILIPKYGIHGAAFSTLIAVIYTSMISLYLYKRTRIFFTTQLKAFYYAANLLNFKRNIKAIEKNNQSI